MHKNILITGGCGFVGSSLALMWKEAYPASHVTCLDNLKRRGSELNIARLKEKGVEFVHGDIRNPEDFETLPKLDLILECSAEPSVLAGYGTSPEYLINTNLVGTINCLELGRKHEAQMVFLSTSRVYPISYLNELTFKEESTRFAFESGNVPGVSEKGVSELFPLDRARSMYGATKLSSELIIQEYIEMYGLEAIINRCGVLCGPWQFGKIDQGVVVLWAAKHHWQGNLNYIGYGGTGKQVRDILHVRDLFELTIKQLLSISEHVGEVYNVGGGMDVSVSLQELTSLCKEVTGNSIIVGSEPETRVADVPWYITDNSKVTAKTGWKPTTSPVQIMSEIAQWIKDNESMLEGILK